MKKFTKLPIIFQTKKNESFFDATVEQMFSKKENVKENGFIGHRDSIFYKPKTEYYLSEKTRERYNYQLEPTLVTKNDNSITDTDYIFYNDILNYLKLHGGDIGNHNKLFSSEYYSFAPPIDMDKFINYQNYYWYAAGLPVIEISVDDAFIDANIIGKDYITVDIFNTLGNKINFTNGLHVKFTTSASLIKYTYNYFIEGIGRSIRLVPILPPTFFGQDVELLPWDQQEEPWDTLPWDAIKNPLTQDYITIERGSCDFNDWSRTNRWYHIDTVYETFRVLNLDEKININNRAQRPIIEFKRDLELMGYGNSFQGFVKIASENNFAYFFDKTIGNLYVDYTTSEGVYIRTDLFENDYLIFLNPENVSGFDFTAWDTIPWDGETEVDVTDYVWKVKYNIEGKSYLVPVAYNVFNNSFIEQAYPWPDAIEVGSNVFVMDGKFKDRTFVKTETSWEQINDMYIKTKSNQEPLFVLYDYRGIRLDDEDIYPESNFLGSKIFSYKTSDTNPISDLYIKKPLTYSGQTKISDIVFEHNLETEIHYDNSHQIIGYYFFNDLRADEFYDVDLENTHLEHTWVPSNVEKIYFVDKYFVQEEDLEDTTVKFFIGVVPYNNDIKILLNGYTFNNFTIGFDSNISLYYVEIDKVYLSISDNLDIFTYTLEDPHPNAKGYFEVTKSFKNNPLKEEITEYKLSDFSQHFRSIIQNQEDINQELTNYRDTEKDLSLGEYITQSKDSLFKAAFCMLNDSTDFIKSVRFASQAYTRFKNKFLKLVQDNIINGNINDLTTIEDDLNLLMEKYILMCEYVDSFSDSHMFTYGEDTDFIKDIQVVSGVTTYIETGTTFDETKDIFYVFDNTNDELLLHNVDYTYEINGGVLTIEFLNTLVDKKIKLYKNTKNVFVPATPSKLGMYPVFVPRIETDESFVDVTEVIIGHDGSKTPVYGDKRDLLWLEIEKRIYNAIKSQFKNEDFYVYDIKNIQPGKYRETYSPLNYHRNEYNSVMKHTFLRWCVSNQVSYKNNNFVNNDWRTWNFKYNSLVGDIPAAWRGIYVYYYDTYRPHTHPWECLGFSEKPTWWDGFYTTDYTSNNTLMWGDIEQGIIRQGIRQNLIGSDIYKRTGMSIPVDGTGQLLSPMDLNLTTTVIDDKNKSENWTFGDISPAEYAWMISENYSFDLVETLFLLKPTIIGERYWDTSSRLRIPLKPNHYEQLVSEITLKRAKMTDNIHTENDNIVYGYQQWIVNRLRFNNRDIETEFIEKAKNCNTKLGYKIGGFTNKDTLRVFMESTTLTSTSNSLEIPTSDYVVNLYKGKPSSVETNSGVIVKALSDGRYEIFGYDILTHEFNYFEKLKGSRIQQIEVEGTPIDVENFQINKIYQVGNTVKYNLVYYTCIAEHLALKFEPSKWRKLAEQPTKNALKVSWYRDLDKTKIKKINYGHVFDNYEQVFNFLYSYGEYLESRGWVFDTVDSETNELSNWLQSAKKYLSWVALAWEEDAAIRLNPAANEIKYTSQFGYTDNINVQINSANNLLDYNGVLISKEYANVYRKENNISVKHKDESIGVFLLRVSNSETEHIILFENETNFGDILYEPILGTRQSRLKFEGFRTSGWYGKYEAPGYIINNNDLIQNPENFVNSIRLYHSTEDEIDNLDFENAARHLIGFENKTYLDNLEISSDVQFQFYQGMIRQKGTKQSIQKLLRSTYASQDQEIKVFEEWAIKLAEFGNSSKFRSFDIAIEPYLAKNVVQAFELKYPKNNTTTDDVKYDDKITIDVDDNEHWLIKPKQNNTDYLWNKIDFNTALPYAGPVLQKDVELTTFNFNKILELQHTIKTGYKVWIAKDRKNSWNVFKSYIPTPVYVTGNVEGLFTFNHVLQTYDHTYGIDYSNSMSSTDNVEYGTIIVNGKAYNYKEVSGGYELYNSEGKIIEDDVVPVGSFVQFFKTLKNAISEPTRWEETSTTWKYYTNNVLEREKEKLIDTKLIQNLYVYEKETDRTIVVLPVVDIYKGILPPQVEKNIDYKTQADPAFYNIENDMSPWAIEHLGYTWWDLSTCAIMLYEQGTYSERRQNWNKFHPDSSIDIYEWVESTVPPSSYSGIVKDVNKYTVKYYYDDTIGTQVAKYYFWVKSVNVLSSYNERTLTSEQIERMLRSPTDYGLQWFCPVLENATEHYFITSNITPILNNNYTVLQMNYKVENVDANKHVEWYLCSEQNKRTPVKEQHWGKMVDSLCEWVVASPEDVEDLENNLITEEDFKKKYFVPSVDLSEYEKYGINFRPRQTMFKNPMEARRVLYRIIFNLTVEDTTDTTDVLYLRDEAILENIEHLTYEQSLVLRNYLDELKNVIFPNYGTEININKIFFRLLNYIFNEQSNISWAFKTSYVYLEQEGQTLEQTRNYVVDPFDSVLQYINEAKPYHTKIRNYTTTSVITDESEIETEDFDKFKIKVKYFPFCGTWDSTSWDSLAWDGCDSARLIDANGFGPLPWDKYAWDIDLYDGEVFNFFDAANFNTNFDSNEHKFTYIANGTDTIFSVDYSGFDIIEKFLAVYVNGNQTLSYYISGTNIVFLEAPVAGSIITIFEVQPINSGEFLPSENKHDYIKVQVKDQLLFNIDIKNDSLTNVIGSFKMYVYENDVIDYFRNNDEKSATLKFAIDHDDKEITVENVGITGLVVPTYSEPGYLWIGSERIAYYILEDNLDGSFTLKNIIRGTKSTPKQNHAVGKKIFTENNENIVTTSASSLFWINNISLENSTTTEALFIKDKPGTFLP